MDEAALARSFDYAITAVGAPASALPGSVFGVTTTICNVGHASGPSSTVQIVLSSDPEIDASDPVIAWRQIGSLSSYECSTRVTQVSPSIPISGWDHLLATVEPVSGELVTSNNSAVGPLGIFQR